MNAPFNLALQEKNNLRVTNHPLSGSIVVAANASFGVSYSSRYRGSSKPGDLVLDPFAGSNMLSLLARSHPTLRRRARHVPTGLDAGRGVGEGLGMHICTGLVFVRDAQPGDVIELRIIDVVPRFCANPGYPGKAFGSNAAAWWDFHYKDLITEPKPREVITVYEVDASGERNLLARHVFHRAAECLRQRGGIGIA
jgi:hypothetical protein